MNTVLKNRVGVAPPTEVPDLTETTLIEQDASLYRRVLERSQSSGNLLPAEVVLDGQESDA